ncbi:MAG: histidine kinase dimerization/phosphoacceptor domain-containing protein, partial [Nocardioidaceae bacterium]
LTSTGMIALLLILWWLAIKPLVRLRAGIDRAFLSNRTQRLEARVRVLSSSRADTVDQSAAELRRIERDLHDGAQARLVALGMSLGMADEMMASEPETARKMLAEARTTTTAALTCAASYAGSIRRCWQTVVSSAPCRRSRWTWRYRSP